MAQQDFCSWSFEAISREFKYAADFICQRVVNREEVVEQALCALLTGEHLLLQSRTGVGKSLLAEQIFTMFSGARVFRVQASKEQQPDTYFGALDIEELKRGRIVHNIEGSIVDCEFAFIDEIFDANDFTLRALLSVLNERQLMRGVQNVPAKLHTVIAATNYLRVSEITEAILDRFLYKAVILPDKEPYIQYKIAQQFLLHGGKPAPPPRQIPFALLKYVHHIVTGQDPERRIEIRPELVYFANLVIRYYEVLRNRALREHYRGATPPIDYYISPRTQAKSLTLLRAIALLHGRDEVTPEDVGKLYFIFATVGVPEEVELFRKAYSTILSSLQASNGFEQLRLLLAFQSLLEQLRQDRSLFFKPLSTLTNSPLRRTFLEWLRETFGGADHTVEQNKRILEHFLRDFVPTCEEVRELKQALERELFALLRSLQ
ncbi:ATPase RavA [bacterium HR21]|jgi:MoxR-like ATPase|nr:ATPase RavA [bacterium HR21]